VWRADVVHCGTAYSETNARTITFLEPVSLPVELRTRTAFLLDEQHVEEMERTGHGAQHGEEGAGVRAWVA
jgi:hypothetical protein